MENSVDDGGKRIAEGFDELRHGISEKAQEVRSTVNAFVDENPLGAVGIAFGVGFLLSGALVSRLTARLIGIGGRIIIGSVVRQAVASLGPNLILDALRGEGGQAAGPGDARGPQTERH
jgi:hypothetical protein